MELYNLKEDLPQKHSIAAKHPEKVKELTALLKPIFKDETRDPHSSLFFRFASNRAIIQGDWKLVTHRASQWELYDISKDGTELNNLAAKHPEKVTALTKLWHQQATELGRLKGKNVAPVSGKMPPVLEKSGVPARGRQGKGKGKR